MTLDSINKIPKKQLTTSQDQCTETEQEILKDAQQKPKQHSITEVLTNMPNVGEDADFDCR